MKNRYKKLNPELKKGDRIILVDMDDEYPTPFGTKGTVLGSNNILGVIQYMVRWDDGSSLDLIDGVDSWILDEENKSLKESEYERSLRIMDNIDILQNFNVVFLKNYLLMIRDSGIVNMLGSASLLYAGKQRIKHEFTYSPQFETEEFEKVLENADIAQSYMIQGTIKWLKSKGKEPDLENINRYIGRLANKVLNMYIILF